MDRAVVSDTEASLRFVSAGVVRLADQGLGYGRAVLARNPDGHVLQLAAE